MTKTGAGASRRLSYSATTAATVRYVPGGDNAVLCDALYEAWGRRCHLCRCPKLFQDIQIDHLIAHTTTAAELQRLKREYGLPPDFEVHGPANLAPACGACNREKGIRVLGPAQLDLRLQTAATHVSAVAAAVQSFATANKIGRSLRVLRTADLSDPTVRAAFEQHAPAIVQELALLDERKADFLITRSVDLDLGYPDLVIDLTLDARGRTSTAIIEKIGGCTLDAALELGVAGLAAQISSHARTALEADDVEMVCFSAPVATGGPLSAADPDCTSMRLTIDTVNAERDGATLYADFDGRFEGAFSGFVVRSALHGGLEDWNGEVGASGRFRITCGWDLAAGPGSPHTQTSKITDWDHFKALVWTARPKPFARSETGMGKPAGNDRQPSVRH